MFIAVFLGFLFCFGGFFRDSCVCLCGLMEWFSNFLSELQFPEVGGAGRGGVGRQMVSTSEFLLRH